jgi:hypothetical protein
MDLNPGNTAFFASDGKRIVFAYPSPLPVVLYIYSAPIETFGVNKAVRYKRFNIDLFSKAWVTFGTTIEAEQALSKIVGTAEHHISFARDNRPCTRLPEAHYDGLKRTDAPLLIHKQTYARACANPARVGS